MTTTKNEKRSPRADEATQAFLRGDFRAVRRLAPEFVAPRLDGGLAPLPLFAHRRLVPAIAWGSAVLLVAAWIYALLQR